MIQRAVRFYEDSIDDMRAWEILRDHKRHGYDSYSKMMIAALLSLAKANNDKTIDVDVLAEKIADKLKMNVISVDKTGHEENTEEGENEDILNEALNFINDNWGGSDNE